ncbi:DUF2480 family protein [Mesohalobacter halotolerans]|jgi:hypothetical protein|uniref:DUF2480 family protein n=1 Tax=Mesohalobacter halotolerans TaxID=1883405 RepID=A0A4V6ALL4_9FLAO|nr:DUF2480 family protein [Mesohalobacter halotolerans]MBS3738795.1 DUF2480 family protein [Psychroflexus sp.]NBC57718.1 DUF2480 family protein [Bacteroidota bacterium]TKS57515.1 DUF2480 family protein [Mesohalobacter halotolerans]
MPEEIVNRVAKSPIKTFNLEELYQEGKRYEIDLSQWLYEGFILKEKDFREALKKYDWTQYQDGFVALHCSTEAIIPAWAYMLVSTYLHPITQKVIVGSQDDLNTILFAETIKNIDLSDYENKPVIVKGCSEKPVPETAYILLIKRLQPIVKSLMFGEACSAVPLFKPKK